MDDELSKFLAGQKVFGARVHAVREEQWDAPTPNSEWTVADLVSHLIEEHRWASPLVHGQDLDTARKVVEGSRKLPVHGGVGANLAEEWDEAAVESADAFSADGALARTVALSRGPTPASAYIREMIFDLIVHSWDLGKAIGYEDPLPDDLVQAGWEIAQEFGDMSDSDMFAAPVSVPEDAPTIDKLVARTGRHPSGQT
jgi:uncharacterized protein (TIGR03086 family)